MTERAGLTQDRGQRVGQCCERRFAADQDVEARVGGQRQRVSQAALPAPARATSPGDRADLRGAQGQPLAVKGTAETHRYGSTAIPAELDHRRLEAGKRETKLEAGRLAG